MGAEDAEEHRAEQLAWIDGCQDDCSIGEAEESIDSDQEGAVQEILGQSAELASPEEANLQSHVTDSS